MSNGWGNSRVTRDADLRAYDVLPRAGRDFLKYTVADWSAPGILGYLRKCFALSGSREQAVQRMRAMVRRETEEDTYRAYGPDHPQSDRHGRRLKPAANACWSPRPRLRA